jgi:uncharacterized protein YabN with tetrapyrrole methylase and pyrophosphatase domain
VLVVDLLEKVVLLEHSADDFGFRWENTTQIMAQIESECAEIEAHLAVQPAFRDTHALQEEIGDLLHAVFSLCVYCEYDPTDTMRKTYDKFERRFNAVKSLANEQGLSNLKGLAFDELMHFWRQAKRSVG